MIVGDPTLLTSLAARSLVALSVAIVLFAFHKRYTRGDLGFWARSWIALAGFWILAVLSLEALSRFGHINPVRILLGMAVTGAALLHVSALAAGSWEISTRRPVKLRDLRTAFLVCVAIAVAFPLFLLILPDEPRFQLYLPVAVHDLAAGVALIWSGHRIRRSHMDHTGAGFPIFSAAFTAYGVLRCASFVLAFAAIGQAKSFPAATGMAIADVFFMIVTGLGMMIFVLEDEREAAVEAASQVEHVAYHDPLTGLPNRALFMDRLIVALAHANRHQHKLGIIFLDLDRFKQINDSLGHTMGDTLLKSVAERIRKSVREEDTIARFGGDEFAVLIHILGKAEHAGKIARKILDALASPFALGERELFITASAGIAIYPNDGLDAEALIKNADTSMYRAKHQGGDGYQFYTPSMNSRALEMLELESSLRKALKNNELTLFYQPLIDLQSGLVYGLEALIRWNHPEHGVMLPDRFIQTAEVSGLIIPMGNWVLREACRQARFWQRQKGTDLVVSVNLSARQFHQSDLTEQVRQALEESRLPARLLELEITETNAMQDVNKTIAILRELKELGVRIAIDDFGTGYSSLSYLKQFPVDTLKLDQSFVRDLIAPQDAKIVSGVIAMAHSMSLQVMAEGVETLSQLDFLRANECDKLQGFLFSRPLPPEHFDRYMTHHKPWRGLA
ncbi:MAG TPA: EAL domain-containing protein [Thermoanaerobaculia bacterium]|nr:EAL domain-containing protein [Thermoanaerobaculia bacterium]